jgi:ubiquinone/menaquinone biosynthesis C-methylase UbiE
MRITTNPIPCVSWLPCTFVVKKFLIVMADRLLYSIIFLALSFTAGAQQKPKKNLAFCGFRFVDTAVLRHQFEKQLAFLRISDNDTIVDIGSSSGAMEGCLGAIGNFSQVNFILVDIDSNCLNRQRVNNMIDHYAGLKGEPLGADFTIINNTPDSLYLPSHSYRHAWLMNTLHEIPDKQKMANDINAILKPGGELILLEILSRPGHTRHGGCKQPLLDEHEIKRIFEENGFTQTETLWNPTNAKKFHNPYYMVRFIKK